MQDTPPDARAVIAGTDVSRDVGATTRGLRLSRRRWVAWVIVRRVVRVWRRRIIVIVVVMRRVLVRAEWAVLLGDVVHRRSRASGRPTGDHDFSRKLLGTIRSGQQTVARIDHELLLVGGFGGDARLAGALDLPALHHNAGR